MVSNIIRHLEKPSGDLRNLDIQRSLNSLVKPKSAHEMSDYAQHALMKGINPTLLYTTDNNKQTKDQPDRTITGKKPSDASFDETGTVKTTELDRLELEALTEQEKMSVNLKKNLK